MGKHFLVGGNAQVGQVEQVARQRSLDAVKAAEDGSGDTIIRLYESKHAACDACLTLNLPAGAVYACDMLENPSEQLSLRDGRVQLSFRGFEVKTLRVKRG